jgi:hypothetical protein
MERIVWASLAVATIEVPDLLGPSLLGEWATPVRAVLVAIMGWKALPIIATTALALHAYVADTLMRTVRYCVRRLIAVLEGMS